MVFLFTMAFLFKIVFGNVAAQAEMGVLFFRSAVQSEVLIRDVVVRQPFQRFGRFFPFVGPRINVGLPAHPPVLTFISYEKVLEKFQNPEGSVFRGDARYAKPYAIVVSVFWVIVL
jgi:hypothetical protein